MLSVVASLKLLAAPAIALVCISSLIDLAAANYFLSQRVVLSFLAAALPASVPPKWLGVVFFVLRRILYCESPERIMVSLDPLISCSLPLVTVYWCCNG